MFAVRPLSVLCALLPAPIAQDLAATVDAFCEPVVESEVVVGLVIGVIDGEDRLVRGYGRLLAGADTPPEPTTLYEIGSISKVFTGLLLADAAERGLVALDDPVQMHLPEGVTLRPWGGHDILLWHLATHSSGLPRMPRDEAPDPNDPFAHYDVAGMHAAIDDARARRRPGSSYEYSNLGVGILGYVMMRVNGCETFDEVLRERITGPLGMADTAVGLGPELRRRFAPPHDADLAPSHAWNLATMAGAGGIRSTVPDMLEFAALQLAPGDSPLAGAVALTQKKHHDGRGGIALGLGWHFARDGTTLVHSGQTGGYHAYMLVSPATRRAVCMLTNTATGAADLAVERLLQKLAGLDVEPLQFEKPIAVERAKLRPLAGRYRMLPGMELEVTLRDNGLYAQLTGQSAFRLHARSPTEFFYRVVDASVTFELDGDEAERLVLHQNGRDMTFRRIVDRDK